MVESRSPNGPLLYLQFEYEEDCERDAEDACANDGEGDQVAEGVAFPHRVVKARLTFSEIRHLIME